MLYQPPQVTLGLPPWSEEDLERAALINYGATQKSLKQHPARDISERLVSLASVLRLFNKTGEAILQLIEQFHHEAHNNNLFRRNRRQDRQRLEDELQEQLYVFAASSMTLVDQSRALTSKIHVQGYRERITSDFSDNPQHRFVQELRVDMIHIQLHVPGWQLTSGREEDRTTRFLIHQSQLRRVDEYHAKARKFVADNPAGINVALLVSTYSEKVNDFHVWLSGAVESVAFDNLIDLRRCQRIVDAVGSRMFWQFILSQFFIQGKKDPYAYLDQYLTLVEMQQVQSLPHRSRLQIDRIIELIDDKGACNVELRELVYRAFNVVDS
jgi:hypothetical protein